MYNCGIVGEERPKGPDWDAYFSDDGISDEDLSKECNQIFLEWLLSKVDEYESFVKETCINGLYFLLDYKEIANRLYGLFIKENEKQEKMELHKKRKKPICN